MHKDITQLAILPDTNLIIPLTVHKYTSINQLGVYLETLA